MVGCAAALLLQCRLVCRALRRRCPRTRAGARGGGMNLWVYNLREVQRRPGRMVLTLLGIALGLATVVATRLTIRTVDRAYRDLFEDVAGRPALEITAKGQGGFATDAVSGLE